MKMNTLLKIALLFLTLILVACGGSGGGGSAGGGGTPNPTKIRIIGATGNEGGNIIFTVTSNQAIAKQITFKYEATVDNKATNPASISDLSSELTGTSTIDANNTTATISIAIANDNLREHNETFLVMLSDLSPTSDVTFTDHTAIGTILANDDATGIVTISLVTDAKASEDSGTIKFKVTSNFSHSQDITFGYEVDLDNSSADTDDFEATSGTARILADSTSTTISISLRQDTTAEPDETFRLLLTNPTSPNATLDSAKNSATGTILNDDLGEISNAIAILGDTAITLNWTNTNSNIFAGVIIAQTTSTDAPLDCASATNVTIIDAQQKTSGTIIDLTNGTAYSFRICARSKSDSLSGGFPLPNLIPQPTVDNNGNGLIEIADATALYNIRHNLAGTGYKTSGTAANFTRGCPTSGCNGYELVNDIINLSSSYSNWIPIGINSDGNFRNATFDGNNYTISGLAIDRASSSDVGLFSIVNNATIKNLKLANVAITGDGNVGALVGKTTGTTTLSNIELIGDARQESSNAEIKGNRANVGGLVGNFAGAISDASSSLTVRGRGSSIGGLVGWLQSGSIKNSNSSGSVSVGADRVGGLVGHNSGNIRNSWASGEVTGNGNEHGGLVGQNDGNIRNSWASGKVTGNGNDYGGLVGQDNTNATISNSWASGKVTGGSIVGGLVGYNNGGIISNSWASGEVIGNSTTGGLVGQNFRGNINRRNYQLDASSGINENFDNLDLANDGNGGISFVLGGTVSGTTIMGDSTAGLIALENLSGDASGGNASYGTHSNWHAGFGSDPFTMFCNTNGDETIDINEKKPTNSVWVMAPAANNVTTEPTADYYQIPAIRCIGNTDTERKANIDLQRSKFPKN